MLSSDSKSEHARSVPFAMIIQDAKHDDEAAMSTHTTYSVAECGQDETKSYSTLVVLASVHYLRYFSRRR